MTCCHEHCPNFLDGEIEECADCATLGPPCGNGTRGCEGFGGDHPCGECLADATDSAYDRGRDEGWGDKAV